MRPPQKNGNIATMLPARKTVDVTLKVPSIPLFTVPHLFIEYADGSAQPLANIGQDTPRNRVIASHMATLWNSQIAESITIEGMLKMLYLLVIRSNRYGMRSFSVNPLLPQPDNVSQRYHLLVSTVLDEMRQTDETMAQFVERHRSKLESALPNIIAM